MKIKSGITLKKIHPQIYVLKFKTRYDLCMHFLRYQEIYESPSSKFRGKQFTIIDFMEWYSKKFGKYAFTYPIDWTGFNIPGKVISNTYNNGIKDYNKYDKLMIHVYNTCAKESSDFYLIGVYGKSSALKHEIAHGLFYTDNIYKSIMEKLIKELPTNVRNKMSKELIKMGYSKNVHIDEIQAYMATGLDGYFKKAKGYRKPFIKVFKQYYGTNFHR